MIDLTAARKLSGRALSMWSEGPTGCNTHDLARALLSALELLEQAEVDTERKVDAELRGRLEAALDALEAANKVVAQAKWVCDLVDDMNPVSDPALAPAIERLREDIAALSAEPPAPTPEEGT